ncbi:zf-HC2 domain-containing protein [Rhodopila globiformis]|uniref:Putative zinc-finger domain-containing protein n=1 Tax=Rhodopila globiformis TaxID=1071 RepID=A0A2S6MVF7_RHOGL|nr:zf-HC2 domain-containing protein [Rhodopila globiformis]PPQ26328.1 hypothetical protein CCS01_30360 [Rhodopila globiformis]
MLSCRDVAGRASALIDGDLGARETAAMRLHLAMCRGCQRFLRQMRATRDLTQAAVKAEAQHEGEDARIAAILSELHDAKPSGD